MTLKIDKNVLFGLLQQRCDIHGCKFISERNFETFSIVQCTSGKQINFLQAVTEKRGIIKISTNHLYGMHDPILLFNLFEIFNELNLKCSLYIVEDTLMLLNQKFEKPKKASNKFFQLLTKKCDDLLLKLKQHTLFKFQLNNDGFLVINNCLKLSIEFLKKVIKNDLLELVVNLSNAYLHCFSKTPICIKVHSIAEDTVVHDFQLFSYLYIMNNKETFFECVKLLYPFVDAVDNVFLDKCYMEIMPIDLITDYHYAPKSLCEWLRFLRSGTNQKFFCTDVEENLVKSLNKNNCDAEYVCTRRRINLEKENEVLKDIVVDAFEKIEKEDGICLILEKRFIDIFFIKGAEDDIDYHQQMVIQFLIKIQELQDNSCLSDLNFCVTSKGSIIFNDYCEVWPFILVKVKNIVLLLNTIKCVSDSMTGIELINERIEKLGGENVTEEDDKIELFWCRSDKVLKTKNRLLSVIENENEDEFRHDYTRKRCWEIYKKSEDFLINIAKLFNPLLSNIPSCLFKIKNFCCVPSAVFLWKPQLQTKLISFLCEIRKNHICLSSDPSAFNKFWVSYIECDLLFVYAFGKQINNFKRFLGIMEDIVAEIGRSITINALTGTLLVEEKEEADYEKAHDVELLEQCLNTLKRLNKTVCLDSDEDDSHSWLSFDWYLEIKCDAFLKIKSYQKFFSALKFFKDLHNAIDSYCPEQWKNFGMIDNQTLKDNFLEIAKILYPVIDKIEDKSILSCLNILPENIIPSRKIVDPNNENIDQQWMENGFEHLKKNLKKVREVGCTLWLKSSGEISTKYFKGKMMVSPVELPPSKWLQIKCFKAFKDMYEIMCKLCDHSEYSLFSSGCIHEFDNKRDSRRAYSLQSEEVYQILVKKNLQDLIQSASYYYYVISSADAEKKVTIRLTKGEDGIARYPQSLFAEGEKKITVSLTVDSDGNILIGNFIWMRPTVNRNLIPEIVVVAVLYEDAITEYDNNLMKSVKYLKNQKNAIVLAQRMNTMLTKIDDETLCKNFIRIFPECLCEKWSEDSDFLFQTMMNAFKELEQRTISWSMNFNGHFLISEYMTLTAKQLSRIKNFNEFEQLLIGLREPVNNYLTCKEEIMYARNKEKKVIRTKTDASKIFNVREKYTNIRIDPNLALVIENILIIHPEDFLRHTDESVTDILSIIKNIKAAFNSTEDILFQFGHVDFPILTSIFYSADEQEIQYADNLKAFLQDTVNIKIEETTKMFMLNDSLRIHPRSFFHLQNARNVMTVLKQFDPKHLLLYQEEEVKNRLEEKIKKNTSKSLQEHCLSKISEMLMCCKDDIKQEAILKHLNEQQHDLKSLCVNGHFIFKEPFLYKMFNKNGEIKLPKEIIVTALNIASDLDESCKCKDMIDFSLLAFAIHEYCKGIEERENKLIKTAENKIPLSPLLTSQEHYNKTKGFLMVQINKIKTYNSNQQFSFIELENWLNKCEKYDSFEKCLTEQHQQMERDFLIRLERIISKERLEFEQPRRICLTMLGKLFWTNITKIDFPGIEHIYLNSDEKEMHGIEKLKIKSVKIFKAGIAYVWLKGGTKLKFNESLFILAMKYSASLEENLKCQNTFDFNSVLEILNEYCQGAEVDNKGKLTKGKNSKKPELSILESQTEYEKMVKFFDKEMNTIKLLHDNDSHNYKYFFKTVLKALHHWLKHGYDFDNVKHYYDEMNRFFSSTKEYKAEFNTQDGYLLLRNYRDRQFFGSLVVSRQSDEKQKSIVATFYAQSEKNALFFTDVSVKFEHEIMKCSLTKTKVNSYFCNFDKKLETTLKRMGPKKMKEAANVKGILILLQKCEDYDDNFAKTMLEKLESIYTSASIAVCVNLDAVDEKWLCLATFLQNYDSNATKFSPLFINKETETMEYIRYTANTGSKIGNEIHLMSIEDKSFYSLDEKITSMGDEQFDFSSVEDILVMFDDTLMAEKIKVDFYENFKNILLRLINTFINATIVLSYKDCIIETVMLQSLKKDTNNKIKFVSVGNYITFSPKKQYSSQM